MQCIFLGGDQEEALCFVLEIGGQLSIRDNCPQNFFCSHMP